MWVLYMTLTFIFLGFINSNRFIEWMNCCCAGSENSENGCGDEELLFPVSPVLPCRDTMFQHPRTNSCDLLSQLPFSMPLDSGYIIYHSNFFTNFIVIKKIFVIICILIEFWHNLDDQNLCTSLDIQPTQLVKLF